MRLLRFLAAAGLVAAGATALAAGGRDVDTNGSAPPHRKPTLATAVDHQLRANDVPSTRTDPASVKAQADADMAARDARAKGPRLKVQRQNLKGKDAARAIAAQTTPNTIDHDTAYGNKDHTEQVTNLKITVKK
jgi:hypothetical protein